MLPNVIYIVHDAKLQQIFYIANDLSKKVQNIFILQTRLYKMGIIRKKREPKRTPY